VFVGIRETELKKLYGRSGNVCAFADCHMALTSEGGADPMVVLGEAAHIVAESADGPRGNSTLTPSERNRAENLILVCSRHHQLIDAKPAAFTVEILKQMKLDHEAWVMKELGADAVRVESPRVIATVHSSVLALTQLPAFVFSAPCDLIPPEILTKTDPFPSGEIRAFTLKEERLIAFHDLSSLKNPFAVVANPYEAQRHPIVDWLDDPDHSRWVIELLNRSMRRFTSMRGLWWDNDHKRYYFPCPDPPADRTVRYRGLNQQAERGVVWQPKRKSTGEPRGHWYHLAFSSRFLRTGSKRMVLSIRPELRITKDGVTPIDSERIGAKVTKKKSRVFNYDLLRDVNFWRDYLGGSSPHIRFWYGSPGQALVISTLLQNGSVTWPGLPPEHAMPFTNVEYLDDLFTWAEVHSDEGYEDEDEEDNGVIEIDDLDPEEPSVENVDE
jgi:hypothetical protein